MSSGISTVPVWITIPIMAFGIGQFTSRSALAEDNVHWRPAATRVFIASLCWYKGEKKESFPVDERLDDKMAEFFIEKGVPKEQVTIILDKDATVKHIQQEFIKSIKESKPGELLFAYISGHGCPGQFCCFDGELNWTWFFNTMEKEFHGNRVLLTSDCCFSGGPVDIAKERKSKISYACLSSTSHQVAGSGWRFAQCLMRGFEGHPVVDLNDDGHIELEELAEYTKHYMAFCAEGMPMFATTQSFSPKLQLSKTKGKKHEHAGEFIEAKYDDGWYPAEIIGPRPKGFRIHYVENTKTDNDRNLTKDEIRPFKFAKHKVGSTVSVSSGDSWKKAEVVETFDSLCRCRIAGDAPDDTEWYGPSRIRSK